MASDRTISEAAEPPTVKAERGMVLLYENHPPSGIELPVRYELWTVASVRKTAKGASLRLLGWSPGCLAEATATFPNGEVAGSWTVFGLSQRDYGFVYRALTRTALPSPDSSPDVE